MSIFILLCVIGLVNAGFVRWQYRRFQKTKQPMFCLIGGSCARVIGSRYGSTGGMKNETIGIAYYLAVLTLIGLIHAVPVLTAPALTILFGAVGIAAVFSLYLLYIQLVVLRSLCSWCLIAIAINTALLAVTIWLF